MTTLSYTIPVAGTTLNSVADPEIATALQTIQTWGNGNIDGANVSATLTGRRLSQQAWAFLGPSAGASGNYFLAADGSLVAAGSATAKPLLWWYLDPANYAVTGKSNTQLTYRLSVLPGVAAGITLTAQLAGLTVTGGSGQITPSVNGLYGSGAGIAPSTSTPAVVEGAAFSFPAAGAYAPIINLSGASAANSATSLMWQLFVLNN